MPADLITLEKQLTAVNTAADLSELTAQILVNVATKTGEQAGHTKDLVEKTGEQAGHTKDLVEKTGEQAGHTKDLVEKTGEQAGHTRDLVEKTGEQAGHTKDLVEKTGEQAAHIRVLANNSSVSGLHLASIARRGGEEDPVYARVELHRDTFEKIRNLLTEFCGTPKPEMGELIAQCQMLESRLQDLEFRHQTLMERFEGHHHTGSRRGPVNDTE